MYPVETTEGELVNIVKKEERANIGTILTADDGRKFIREMGAAGQKPSLMEEVAVSDEEPTVAPEPTLEAVAAEVAPEQDAMEDADAQV